MQLKQSPKGKIVNHGSGMDVICKLKKGDVKVSDRQPGKELDYIRPVWNTENPYVAARLDDCQAAWNSLYGQQAKFLPIVRFNRDSVDHVWSSANERWGSSGSGKSSIVNRCDGETCFQHRDDDGKLQYDPIPCFAPKCGCAPVGRLFIWLPDFFKATGILGEFMVETHAMTDIGQIAGVLKLGQQLTTIAFGEPRIRELIFSLRRTPMRINAPTGVTVTKHMLKLEIADSMAQALASHYQLVDPTHDLPALPSGMAIVDEDDDDTGDVVSQVTLAAGIYVKGPSPDNPDTTFMFRDRLSDKWYSTTDRDIVVKGLPQSVDVDRINHDESIKLPVEYLLAGVDPDGSIVTLSSVIHTKKGK